MLALDTAADSSTSGAAAGTTTTDSGTGAAAPAADSGGGSGVTATAPASSGASSSSTAQPTISTQPASSAAPAAAAAPTTDPGNALASGLAAGAGPTALGAGLPTPPPSNPPGGFGPLTSTPPALGVVPQYDAGLPNPAGDLVATGQGAAGNVPNMFSAAGVRYFDGAVRVASTDLASAGFGLPFGVTRSWTNLSNVANGFSGAGMVVTDLPHLRQDNGGNTLVAIANGFNARWFDLSGGVWTPRFFVQDTLVANTTTHEFIETDSTGAQIHYNDFSGSVPANEQGTFKSYNDSNGNIVSVTAWTSDNKVQEIQRTSGSLVESYLFSYIPSGQTNAGLVSSVVLRRSTNGGSTWTTVRQVQYTYYDGVIAHGNLGDLKLAQVQDGSGNTLDTTYYRYYTGESGGYTHGLKYIFRPDSYARLTAALGTSIDSISDTSAAPYADNYFEYVSSQRVTKAVIAGDGTTLGSGANGLGTYTYSYTVSSNSSGYNSWAVKTVETLPDSNQNIVYTNSYGEVMLAVYHDATSGNNWDAFFKYDGQGNLILAAAPSAVNGYNDTYSDLLHYVSGSGYQYLNNSSGLITVIDYGSSTTATSSSPGNVANYLEDLKIEQGQNGTAILESGQQYYSRSATSTTIYPLASTTQYRNTDGTGAETTSYGSFAWPNNSQFGPAGMPTSVTVTLPTISTTQNCLPFRNPCHFSRLIL